MNSELQEKMNKYIKELQDVYVKLYDEQKELKEKFDKEGLSIKENNRYKKITKMLNKIDLTLAFEIADTINSARDSLNNLTNTKLSKDDKMIVKATIITDFTELDKIIKEKLETTIEESDILDESFGELTTEEKKTILKVEISKLEKKIKEAEEKNWLDEDYKYDLEQLKKIQLLLNSQTDLNVLADDLEKAIKEKTKAAKQAIVDKYIPVLENIKTMTLEEIEKEIDEGTLLEDATKVLDGRSLLQKAKDKLSKKDEEEKKSHGKLKKVAIYVAGLIIIIVLAKSCSKGLNNNNELVDNNPGLEQDDDIITNNELIQKLVNEYGIDKNIAIQYGNVEDFNIDYILDYESVRLKYNITPAEAVDYVNRSYQIQNVNFFDDATITQVVEIVKAIDNKEMFTSENANLAQAFNTSFNRTVDNALFGTVTDEDKTKTEALYSIAKEGTDLDNFLSGYADRVKAILENPSQENKAQMYNYVATFALSVNGFTNIDPDVEVTEPYNEDAQVKDFYDWYMAYDSFIKPLFPIFVDETNFTKWEELQIIMESVFHSPEVEAYMYEICGQGHVLGGK